MNKIVRIKNKYQFEFFFGKDHELTNEEAISMVLGVSPEYYNKNKFRKKKNLKKKENHRLIRYQRIIGDKNSLHYIEKPKNQFNTNR